MKRLEMNSRTATIILSVMLICAMVGFRIWVYLYPEMWTFTNAYQTKVEHLYVISAADGKVMRHVIDNNFGLTRDNGDIHWEADGVNICFNFGVNMRIISNQPLGFEVGDVVRDLKPVAKPEERKKEGAQR